MRKKNALSLETHPAFRNNGMKLESNSETPESRRLSLPPTPVTAGLRLDFPSTFPNERDDASSVGSRKHDPDAGEHVEDIDGIARCDWVDLRGLMAVAEERLGKEKCVSLCELGQGSHNHLYKLSFSDGTEVAASISNSPKEYFTPLVKESEVATMQYLHSSPQYNVPVPEVYAWDFSFENPVRAPYILREVIPGRNLGAAFPTMKLTDQLAIVRELAAVQAELAQPSEFKQIGNIYQRKGEDGQDEFYIGPLLSCKAPDGNGVRGPFDSLEELWQARIERETVQAIELWSELPTDEIPTRNASPLATPNPSQFTPQLFGEMMQLLSGLTSRFKPPGDAATTCIQHSDLAIRNVLFDDKELKITGVIDWEFAQVVPRIITGRFPNDIGCDGNEVLHDRLCERGESDSTKFEFWNNHYYDWTSMCSPLPVADDDAKQLHNSPSSPSKQSETPGLSQCLDSPRLGSKSDTQFLIRLFYLRKFYASAIGNKNFRLSSLFIDSVAYVKFHEIIMGGWESWFRHREWIREVYWRLREKDAETEEGSAEALRECSEMLIRVPEVFETRVRREYLDLEHCNDRAH